MKELGSMAGQEPLEYALHEIIARSQQLLSKGVDDLRPIKRHRRYGPIVEKHTSRIRELGKRYQALELNARPENEWYILEDTGGLPRHVRSARWKFKRRWGQVCSALKMGYVDQLNRPVAECCGVLTSQSCLKLNHQICEFV
ncbi:unnamed protein product [Durusdinium trenchii]|uniref:Uncharacterized protein n=1 Tax=Durusdinium trenchii TaxID=1381693 RepID=A0ABP0NP89_9DINO